MTSSSNFARMPRKPRAHVARDTYTRGSRATMPDAPTVNAQVMAPLTPLENLMFTQHGLAFDGVEPITGGWVALSHGALGRRAEAMGRTPAQAVANLVRVVLG